MDLTAYHFVSLFRNNVQQYPQKDALMGIIQLDDMKRVAWLSLLRFLLNDPLELFYFAG